MEGFLTQGWELILSGCGETSALARGATFASRWLHHEHQSFSNHSVGLDFHTLRGGTDPGDLRFRPRVVGVVDVSEGFWPRDGSLSSRVRRDLGVGPRGNFRPAMAPCHMSPSQSAITQWGWVFHTLRGGIDPWDLRLPPRGFGVVDVSEGFLPKDGKLSSPGSAGP